MENTNKPISELSELVNKKSPFSNKPIEDGMSSSQSKFDKSHACIVFAIICSFVMFLLLLLIYTIQPLIPTWLFAVLVSVFCQSLILCLIIKPNASFDRKIWYFVSALFVIPITAFIASVFYLRFPQVQFIERNKEYSTYSYLSGNTIINGQQVFLEKNGRYIFNNTGKCLYITKVVYSNDEPVNESYHKIMSVIENGHCTQVKDYELKYFCTPPDKIYTYRREQETYDYYIDFIPYDGSVPFVPSKNNRDAIREKLRKY